MSDELNVWREAREAYNNQTNPFPTAGRDAAVAVIRDYGDKRYQQAIADVVEWLRSGDEFALPDHEAAQQITRRFGKGQDHG